MILFLIIEFCNNFKLRLEPILARIKEKRSAVVCPLIDSIDDKTLMYYGGGQGGARGIFSWSLFFDWGQMPTRYYQIEKFLNRNNKKKKIVYLKGLLTSMILQLTLIHLQQWLEAY